MHREITKLTQSKLKKIKLIINCVNLIVFGIMTLWNTPVPESRGYRNKNWTDMDMIIDPENPQYQFVSQHIEYGGSDMPSRRRKVKKINWWLRWSQSVVENHPKDGKWLYLSNLSQENNVPFGLNETKIDYETEKHRAKMVLFENKKIITPTNKGYSSVGTPTLEKKPAKP